ncbi:hypothetical protein HYH03_016413 [Edaphochlamys debaryana]|uniref:RING-type domain-containing protein n=1 Tax=Edaphochlamys debaryana TaxID=47281 RepID=A0A835XRK6_9CHLO|nr:hypothetical protein HYH03_016413 [Edaphochlamys debaryana]|eukprot:KAG2484759.1 hypothetical protein HYH03_016413 [Edaphochlamys debaryana]
MVAHCLCFGPSTGTFERALRKGDVASALAYLEHDPLQKIRHTYAKGNTLLHVAANAGHALLLDALLTRLEQILPREDVPPITPASEGSGRPGEARRLTHFQRISDGLLGRPGDSAQQTLKRFINQPNWLGQTPLMSAAYRGHAAVIRVLLERGANPWARDRGLCSSLHYACLHDHAEAITEILQHPSSARPPRGTRNLVFRLVDLPNHSGYAPLHFAAAAAQPRALGALLTGGANVASRSWYDGHDWITCPRGSTALHLCARRGDVGMCKIILRHFLVVLRDSGAVDPRVHADLNGTRPWQHAHDRGATPLADALLPSTPLALVFQGDEDIVVHTVPPLRALASAALQVRLLDQIDQAEAAAEARRQQNAEAGILEARSLALTAGVTAGGTASGPGGIGAANGAASQYGASDGASMYRADAGANGAPASLSRAGSLASAFSGAMGSIRRQSMRTVRSLKKRVARTSRAGDARGLGGADHVGGGGGGGGGGAGAAEGAGEKATGAGPGGADGGSSGPPSIISNRVYEPSAYGTVSQQGGTEPYGGTAGGTASVCGASQGGSPRSVGVPSRVSVGDGAAASAAAAGSSQPTTATGYIAWRADGAAATVVGGGLPPPLAPQGSGPYQRPSWVVQGGSPARGSSPSRGPSPVPGGSPLRGASFDNEAAPAPGWPASGAPATVSRASGTLGLPPQTLGVAPTTFASPFAQVAVQSSAQAAVGRSGAGSRPESPAGAHRLFPNGAQTQLRPVQEEARGGGAARNPGAGAGESAAVPLLLPHDAPSPKRRNTSSSGAPLAGGSPPRPASPVLVPSGAAAGGGGPDLGHNSAWNAMLTALGRGGSGRLGSGQLPQRANSGTAGGMADPFGGAAPRESVNGLGGPPGGQVGSDTSEDLCGICFERAAILTLHPCTHTLCAQCSREVTRMVEAHPPACPFCRSVVRGFAC